MVNNFPKISIITPCFNHEKFIGQTIHSIIDQNYPNLEYIVINDGSTDNSEEEILKYEKYISKYEFWEGHRNSPVWAINKGFSYASGEIYGWISSDDILLRNSLFTIAKVFTDLKEVSWFTGLATTINSRGELVNSKFRPKHKIDFLVNNWKVIQQESTFFRKSLWDKAGGKLDENYLQAFDTELWTRFFLNSTHYNLNSPIGAFRKGIQSRSVRNLNEFLSYNIDAIKKLRKNSKDKSYVKAYSFLSKKYLKQIMGILPTKLIRNLFKEAILYDVITYSFEKDKFFIEKENPFKY